MLDKWGAANTAEDGGLQWQCTAFWLLCIDTLLESGRLHHQQHVILCAASGSLQRCTHRVSLELPSRLAEDTVHPSASHQ